MKIKGVNEVIRSGVYCLFHKKEVVYIGQSSNPYSRIGTHAREGNKNFDGFRILSCNEYRRRYWEKILINRYLPIYNKWKGNPQFAYVPNAFNKADLNYRINPLETPEKGYFSAFDITPQFNVAWEKKYGEDCRGR
jgi:hypothetical protein|tara:strand:+ start:80 stop:487 length:408 start_codon:yes stop_codon:yes gene_type:complete